MAGALVNFVPHALKEVDHITGLGSCHLLVWTDKSSSEDEREQTQEEDDEHEQTWEGDDECIPPPLLEDNECEEMKALWESNPEAPPGNEMCGWGGTEPERGL